MEVRDAIVAGSITVAFSFVGWAHMMIIDLKDRVGVLENEIMYMSKTLEACIQRDVYEIDKLYMVERLKNMRDCDD